MNKVERINLLIELGKRLAAFDEPLQSVMHQAYLKNQWFTKENTTKAIQAIAGDMLLADLLESWLNLYKVPDQTDAKVIGIVMAGNIPLVGFHDLLSVFAAGHRSKIKLSDKDPYLLPCVIQLMEDIDARSADYFEVVERVKDIDGIIATGSNNTARYFEAYFGKYPNIIRKNRNAVAVLDGNETSAQLEAFGTDVFQYFGLGCRNVSKLYLPENFNFEPLLEAMHLFNELQHHNKYKNNFDYFYTMLILNSIPYRANGCILMTENASFQSRIASLHYEYYTDKKALEQHLTKEKEAIQCIVSNLKFDTLPTIDFGKAQQPSLTDYADGVDTMQFLMNLS